jgi:hypothetical protein
MTTEYREKSRLLALMVSIGEARAACLDRLVTTLPDGGQIVETGEGRRWLVWMHGDERNATPLPENNGGWE